MRCEPAADAAAPARPGVYPMTYEQESLWLDDHLASAPSRYLESWACRLLGQLDIPAAEWAISEIVRRHQVLRSRLVLQDGQLVQVVTDAYQARLSQRSCAPAELTAELGSLVSQPLDLRVAPLRPWLVQLGPADHVLLVQFHHAVVDDWALAIFESEFSELYTARVLGRAPDLDPLESQVGEYALAQRTAGLDPADLAYWRQRMRDVASPCTVPPDRPPPRARCQAGRQYRFRVSPELGRLVRRVSRAKRTTPYTVFAAALAAVLRLQTGQADVIFGTPVSRRGSAALSQMIGCFTDLVPLRFAVGRETSLGALVEQARAEVIGALQHKNVPYAAVLQQAGIRSRSGTLTLCPTALVADDAGQPGMRLPNLTSTRLYVPSGRAKFDVCLTLVLEDDGGYLGMCDYAAELYDQGTAARVAGQFTGVLSSGLAALDQPLTSMIGTAVRGAAGD